MKRRIILVFAALVVAVIAFLAGRVDGVSAASKRRTKHDLELHKQLVDLDRSWLTNVAARPNQLTSGRYTLELRFAGMPEKVSEHELEFLNGRLVKGTKLPMRDILQTGNVVSWVQDDTDEGPSASFVGLIDERGMWGRIYTEPGQGWRQGDPPAYGMWRLYRTSNE